MTNENPPLSLDDEVVVERLLHFCSVCLEELPIDGTGWLECCACNELRHYGCTLGCLCDRK